MSVAPEEMRRLIEATLNEIVDPCSRVAGAPAGMMDMGLVRSIELAPDEGGLRAHVSLSVTHPFCLMAGVFLNEAEQRLAGIAGLSKAEIVLDSTTLWTPELMSADYRERLDTARRTKGMS
jgi:metal-sulfur cluster biosynthetic enzyme